MLPGEDLQLGEQVPQVREVRAPTATRRRTGPLRDVDLRLGEHGVDHGVEARAQARRAHRHPLETVHERFVPEELVDVGPHVGDGAQHPSPRLIGAAGESQSPLHGVVAVVLDLLHRLRGDRRQRLVGRCLQRRIELEVIDGCRQLARNGLREVSVGLLEEPCAAEVGLVTPVGEVVLGAPVERARVAKEGPGVTEQVECDVRERDVFFELGGARDPRARAAARG